MIYTVYGFNYSHSDYNEPYFKRDFTDKGNAERKAQELFSALAVHGRGRVEVAPVNPQTGYHDLPTVWKRETR